MADEDAERQISLASNAASRWGKALPRFCQIYCATLQFEVEVGTHKSMAAHRGQIYT